MITVNGLSLLALIAVAIAGVLIYRAGVMRGRREVTRMAPLAAGYSTEANAGQRSMPRASSGGSAEANVGRGATQAYVAGNGRMSSGIAAHIAKGTGDRAQPGPESIAPTPHARDGTHTDAPAEQATEGGEIAGEKARIIRSLENEAAQLRRGLARGEAAIVTLHDVMTDRARLFRELADARGDTARYRQIVVDLENNAPPPLLDGPGAPDDLKLIVGVGPVLERMLYQLGVSTYRQIAWWTERDIDDFDARLPEFPGRIKRDAWVTQARALHQSKYGEPPARP